MNLHEFEEWLRATPDDIRFNRYESCPLAQFLGEGWVVVYYRYYPEGNYGASIELPYWAKQFINAYDELPGTDKSAALQALRAAKRFA